jgi:hypothetical protein
MEKNFRFWLPLDKLEKAGKDGKKKLKVGGIASTSTKDLDGESLDPNGFDLSYFQNKGIVNWNHNKSPDAVIGEPTEVKLTEKGLYVEAELYADNPLANSVYSLAETLQKSSRTRRLGFSIEGKATERDENDKTKVSKALITNIALTISPKNPDSIVNIVKGNFNELSEEELQPYNYDFFQEMEVQKLDKIEKALSADGENSGKPLKRESVEGGLKNQIDKNDEDDEEDGDEPVKLTKGQAISMLLKSSSVITFEKANQAVEILNNLVMANKKETELTEDVLAKALSVLGIGSEEDAGAENNKKKKSNNLEKGFKGKKEDESGKKANEDVDEDDDEDDVEQGADGITDLKKSIDLLASENIEMFKGSGTLLKGIYDLAVDQKNTIEALQEEIVDLKKSVEDLGETPAGVRKSTSRAVDKTFQKGMNDNDEVLTPQNVMSISANKNQVLSVLDQMSFEKGFNQDVANAMTTYESSGVLSQEIVGLIKSEKGITLVK